MKSICFIECLIQVLSYDLSSENTLQSELLQLKELAKSSAPPLVMPEFAKEDSSHLAVIWISQSQFII